MLVTGENGAGKTNLLEAIHLGTQGFSPRTRSDGRMIRTGETGALVGLRLDRAGVLHEVKVKLAPPAGKSAELDGSRLPSAESLRREFPTLVFTPDRLAVVKGGPAVRRAYVDRVLARLFPALGGLPQEYAAALAQRNAALRRAQLGVGARDAVAPWTERLAELGGTPGGSAPRNDGRARAGVPAAPRGLRASPAGRWSTRASRRRAQRSRPGSRPTSPAERQGSDRTSTTS